MYSMYSQNYGNPYSSFQQSYQQSYQQPTSYQQSSYQQPASYQQSSYPSSYGYSSYSPQQSSYSYSPYQYTSCQVCRIPPAPAPQAASTPKTPAKKAPSRVKEQKPQRAWKPCDSESGPISSFRTIVQVAPEPPCSYTQTAAPCAQAESPCGPCTNEGSLPPYVSKLEEQIRSSTQPISASAVDIIEINGIRGIWLNKAEVENWKGEIPISEYAINDDSNPELVKLKYSGCADRVQELAIKYLKPPRPPTPGPVIIKQEANIPTAPAPPIIIRQLAPEPCNPPPVVIREKPPTPPEPISAKTVIIPGQRLPPPPRRVIVEKLAQAPANPQAVSVERWLPYEKRERKVILEKKPCDPCVEKPKNVVYEWEPQCVNQKTEVKDLGVESADPAAYLKAHGSSLKASGELPPFVLEAKTAQSFEPVKDFELVGDLKALRLINLEKEGLIQYQKYL